MKFCFKYTLIIILAFANCELYSQGFDWQYSARLPFDIPTKFIGITAEYGIANRNSSFSLIEKDIHCCIFEKFEAKYLKIGITSEFWLTNEQSLNLNLVAQIYNGKYSSNIKKLPILNSPDLVTQSEIQYKSNFIELEGKYSRRLFNTDLFINGGLNLLLLLNDTKDVSEFIVSPDGTLFNKLNSNRRIILLNNTDKTYLSNVFSQFVFGLNIGLSYNLDLGLGKYMKIELSSFKNLTSYSLGATNSGLDYGISIKYLQDMNSIFR